MPAVLHCRDYLTEFAQETNTLPVNIFETDNYLLLNSRVIADTSFAQQISLNRLNCIYRAGNTDIAAVISAEYSKVLQEYSGKPFDISTIFPDFPVIPINAVVMNHPWDIINKNGEMIINDWGRLYNQSACEGTVFEGVHFIEKRNIFIANGAVIKPGVVLDAESGPIIIESGAVVMPNAVIIGPVFIGKNALIKAGARIYGCTTIGEESKIGGEVSVSIIHSHTNKQHDGFLGNSYLGQWVNIGADTNNSNLKNNYQPVTATIDGEVINTGLLFAGAIIGDHTKTGINTMLNTGTVIGVCCNIYGSGFPPKYIPSFSWGGSEGFEEYKFEKALQTAQAVVARKKMELSVVHKRIMKCVFDATVPERTLFYKR